MIKPLHQYVVVETTEHLTRREAKERIPSGKVIAVSDQVDLPLDTQIIYSRNAGEYVNYHSRVYLLLKYEDIIALINQE